MLDHRGGRLVELEHDAGRGIEVEQVGERQLFALQNRRRTQARGRIERIPGGGLMRVLSIAKVAQLVGVDHEGCGRVFHLLARRFGGQDRPAPTYERVAIHRDLGESARNGRVVAAGVREGAARQLEAELDRRPAGTIELGDDLVVIVRRHDDEDVAEVLGRRAHEAGTADVDLLDQIVELDPRLRRGLDEWIQIHDDQIDQADTVLRGQLQILGVMPPRQDAAVDLGMERLDAAVHHFGKTGDVADVHHRQAGLGQRPGGAAGRHQLEAPLGQAPGKWNQARLVRNTENRTAHQHTSTTRRNIEDPDYCFRN